MHSPLARFTVMGSGRLVGLALAAPAIALRCSFGGRLLSRCCRIKCLVPVFGNSAGICTTCPPIADQETCNQRIEHVRVLCLQRTGFQVEEEPLGGVGQKTNEQGDCRRRQSLQRWEVHGIRYIRRCVFDGDIDGARSSLMVMAQSQAIFRRDNHIKN